LSDAAAGNALVVGNRDVAAADVLNATDDSFLDPLRCQIEGEFDGLLDADRIRDFPGISDRDPIVDNDAVC
jgi:hypothetical protein